MNDYQREVAQVSQVKKDLDAERGRIQDSKLKEKQEEFESEAQSGFEPTVKDQVKESKQASKLSFARSAKRFFF